MRHAFRVNGAPEWEADARAASVDYVNVRVEACTCGGYLSADPADERAVVLAVVRHQGTLRHQLWRAALESEG